MNKLLSFCIPSYNMENYLANCLDSLLSAPSDVEVLIIDDGSKDKTLSIAKDYEKKYPNLFKAIHEENRGHGGAINNALSLAKGEYFKVLDADDWCDKEALHKLLDFLRKGNRPDLILMNYTYWQDGKTITKIIHFNGYLETNKVVPISSVKRFKITDYITLHSAFYKTSILRECGVILPEHCFYEDNYFVYAPLPYVKTISYIPSSLYQYRVGRAGQSVAIENMIKHWSDLVKCGYLVFDAVDIMPYKKSNPHLYHLLKHQLSLNIMYVPMYPQFTPTKEAREAIKAFWKHCKSTNPKQARMVHRIPKVNVMSYPGAFGRFSAKFWFNLAHKVVKFN